MLYGSRGLWRRVSPPRRAAPGFLLTFPFGPIPRWPLLRGRDSRSPGAYLLLHWSQSDRAASRVYRGGILDGQWAHESIAVPVELSSIDLGPALERPDAIFQHRSINRGR